MNSEDILLARTLPLFRNLSDDQVSVLLSRSYMQRFPRGTLLFDEGQRPDFLMVLLEGSVELFARNHDCREAVMEILFPVDSFILAAALTGAPYLMAARTLQPSRILMLDADTLRRAVAADAGLAASVMAELAAHFRRMVRQVKDLKLRTGAQRLGCYVLGLAAQDGEITLRLDKRTLASRLGMTAENLSRAFSTLRNHGLVVQGSRLLVSDRESLAAFSHPDPLIDLNERSLSVEIE